MSKNREMVKDYGKVLALALFSILIIGLWVVVGSAEQPQYGGTLTIATASEAKVLDPIRYEAIAEAARDSLIFDSLLYQDPQGRVIPLLATALPETPNDTTYIFHLHKGVYFSDGNELTAKDVKYTFDRIADPKEGSPHFDIVHNNIKSVEIIDKYTVKFNMKKPTPLLIIEPFFRGIVDEKAREEMGPEEYARHPIGSGPFKLVKWVKDDYMLLEARKDYWLKKPYLDKVKIIIVPEPSTQVIRLLDGEIDMCNVPHELLKKVEEAKDVRVLKVPQYHYAAMVFNMRRKPFNDIRVRKAIWYLVDREAIMKAARGELANLNVSITPPVVNKAWNFPEDEWAKLIPRQNVEKAKQLLDEAGYTGHPRFKITLTGLSIAYYPPITEMFQHYLAAADIEAKVQNLDLGTWLDAIDKRPPDYDMIVSGWGAGPDPDGWLYAAFHSTVAGTTNDAGYADKEVDKWLDEARSTIDHAKRRELYIKAETKIIKAYPHVWLFNNIVAEGIRTRVHDYIPIPGYGQYIPLVTPFSNVWIGQ